MLTVRPLYCPAAGVPSTAQASRMRGRRHAAANHFQHVSASTAQSLLPAKGRRGARVAAAMRGRRTDVEQTDRDADRVDLDLWPPGSSLAWPCGLCLWRG